MSRMSINQCPGCCMLPLHRHARVNDHCSGSVMHALTLAASSQLDMIHLFVLSKRKRWIISNNKYRTIQKSSRIISLVEGSETFFIRSKAINSIQSLVALRWYWKIGLYSQTRGWQSVHSTACCKWMCPLWEHNRSCAAFAALARLWLVVRCRWVHLLAAGASVHYF